MGKDSGVIWSHHTFNPWWGCTKISPGCKNCYAAAWDARFGGEHWGELAPRRFFGPKHRRQPLSWNAAAESDGVKRLVFCASMADVFEDRPDLETYRAELFETVADTPSLIWLMLTKRPENIERLAPPGAPPPNVWYGTTIEDDHPDRLLRVLDLQRTPAAGRFLSCEPLLSDIRIPLDQALDPEGGLPRIDWVITGAERGNQARPAKSLWFERARDMCSASRTPFFFKQAAQEYEVDGHGDPSLIVAATLLARRDGISEAPKLRGQQWLQTPKIDGLEPLPIQIRFPEAML